MRIPVQNVYFLLLYAWNYVKEGEEIDVLAKGYTRLQDLFAHILADTAARLLARGLDRGYLTQDAAVRGIRGKVSVTATVRRGLTVQAQTYCRYDELERDVLHNQILKATLKSLLELEIDSRIKTRIRRLYGKLEGVTEIRITSRDFSRVQIHRNNRLYDFALQLCRLIHDNLMIEPGRGTARFIDFRADEQKMGSVFEQFLRAFFKREQRTYDILSPSIPWHDVHASDYDLARLPTMQSDIVLTSPWRGIVLDAKFYHQPLTSRSGTQKVRSDHLYQILAYVSNRNAVRKDSVREEAMLLYPVVDSAFSFDFRLNGERVMVRSINLNQPWHAIHRDLLELVGLPPDARRSAAEV